MAISLNQWGSCAGTIAFTAYLPHSLPNPAPSGLTSPLQPNTSNCWVAGSPMKTPLAAASQVTFGSKARDRVAEQNPASFHCFVGRTFVPKAQEGPSFEPDPCPSRLPLSRLEQTDSIPALVQPSGGMAMVVGEMAQRLGSKFTDQKVYGSNPTSASRRALFRLG
ncbi:hypothetical protein T265_10396 [Opisthorchis viverrini]|uniref:Uncharacterized protein n=1 Tax=Opisthorchis viverrini TaxID=6198 RepID=A0A074Z2G0_OPIVI|nr:hypothetical protein T265_10396 [Opisthorchis viverrini]KER21236.1 hypothetical protein T265_10396 [Opisthorchis viverrini]